ncbi:hypothetical protein GTA08_BOTSDO03642 [Neofusicoccum parvum]|uniref:Uncharacterized protein n=2 Tax=Neofusicoccum parvum TaxID=310453 RepID=R1H3R7_BOTPV|nr:hypothetical protein UCRNP2_139 [Neofusicoccum parvum UCRNP2]GME26223.1 hypothetical protein GTA08_BOTSDO03642 [Neofusicoccum parvum]GME59061.1 hypothetical protein GTA08_BOTSDO03642 [Neofusicoccum parvum]
MVVYYELAGRKVGSHVVRAPPPIALRISTTLSDSSCLRTLPLLTNAFFSQLAMGVLGTLFTGIFAATGGSKKTVNTVPPINAASKDEENFITEFLKEAEKDSKH